MGLFDSMKRLFAGGGQSRPKVDLDRRYEKLREGIAGTMSSFYKARDIRTGDIVGLKIIDPKKADPVAARYKGLPKPEEGEIGSKIVGPNVVRTIDWGVSTEGRKFVVMEFLEGTVLSSVINAGRPLSPERRIDLVRQAAEGLATVHRAGFVHHDVCPRNFMVEPAGRLVLIDFGLTVPDDPIYLRPGNRVGTAAYMAPEVIRRRQADRRIDIFALGIAAYEICTLAAPWPKPSKGSGASAALLHDSPPKDVRDLWGEIPEPLAKTIMSSIAARPDDRPPTIEKFLAGFAGVSA
ncbi:MAG: serine/threonine-protein kinase [Planctomycetaceae bacterium]